MFNGKMKALTFSYDDGVTQDQRLIELFDRYGLRATFNLNSGLFGRPGALLRENVTVAHVRPRAEEIAAIYRGHEIAAHTVHHPFLPKLPDREVVMEVETDRVALSLIFGREIVGMAYPCGGANHDARVENLVKEQTGCSYARTIESSGNFALPEDPYAWKPTVYYIDTDEMFELGKQFLALETNEPMLFYIWGHSYELDAWDFWDRFEEFCKMMSGKDDIFYGTNREVLGL
jgi:peptidoglycan/xylan/chitin deacetylase (PgdA/CDA1 family)